MAPHQFIVGTFNTQALFTLAFTPPSGESPASLEVVNTSDAIGSHSWLALSADKSKLYATAWTEPPSLAAYDLKPSADSASTGPTITLLNSVKTNSRSGYVCVSPIAAYSAGGATGEVYSLDAKTGAFVEQELQKLDFVERDGKQVDDGGVMDFGGLRHGAHSADLSPDGKTLYIADIGRNCIFVYSVAEDGSLTLTDKNIAPRPTDGPRHVTPHSGGEYVYSLQEHTSMVDVFKLSDGKLSWVQGVKIIPEDLSPTLFWADEVRVSPSGLWLYASTRGLEPSQKGWVAAFPLLPSGLLASEKPAALFETRTSGGWANAVEPAPKGVSTLSESGGRDWIALTDSEEGWISVLGWDGKAFEEVAKVQVEGHGCATSVWL